MRLTPQPMVMSPETDGRMWDGGAFVPLENRKFTVMLDDGLSFEAAVFKLLVRGSVEYHACISSQAGCRFACTFCTSGRNGLARNLTAPEIGEHVRLLAEAVEIPKFNQLLFMGVGEPLDNFEAVGPSIVSFNAQGYRGGISLATIGIPRHLRKLSGLDHGLRRIWVSLHAATDKKRQVIMPINRKYGVSETVQAAYKFARGTSTEVWINYMVFTDFNGIEEDAKSLVALLAPYADRLGLMLTMPNNDLPSHKAANIEELLRFQELLASMNMPNKIRRFVASGREIAAGCGEFAFIPLRR